ncbi:hypothetical protein AGR2A_pa60163 [Agrobacterium genomosp. 2 str. CFBP 5494]|uniref:Uncharacterized protein n=1 Tax=Agrobacterium genomosp. 2 str. CFBP 5494 TaxID=1183436 RepID=A0A9W5B7E7_9HYPH|nr:hypothetical protein AGR2A_pa60163 [Agrobacterium genomosp. 2 str. CFBP 5494]
MQFSNGLDYDSGNLGVFPSRVWSFYGTLLQPGGCRIRHVALLSFTAQMRVDDICGQDVRDIRFWSGVKD